MNIKDRIIKEVKGVSFRVITESGKERTVSYNFTNVDKAEITNGKERTVSYNFTNVDKAEITNEYNDITNKYQLSVNIECTLSEMKLT